MTKTTFCSVICILLCSSPMVCSESRDPDFHKVFFADSRAGYALGTTNDAAVVFKTTDGGTTWQNVYQTSVPLNGLYFLKADTGFVIGGSGTILYTSDAGKSWTLLKGGMDEDWSAITSDSRGTLFIVGKHAAVIKSLDNGKNWISCHLPGSVDLTNVASLPSGMLFVLGRDRLFTSSDSGVTWSTHGPYKWDALFGLAFASEKAGFLASGLLFQTDNGGDTLKFIPISQSEHVTQVTTMKIGTYVVAGSARSGNTVHIPGEKLPSSSMILLTKDMGKTWRVMVRLNANRSHSAWLEDLFFLGDNGWAVGAEGTVIITQDGGRHWRHLRVR